MSVTRTFTVTVVSTGGGNKYFIDGVQTPTLELVEGATFRFDQSDSSNGTHPLRFATAADASGGTQYTTNVTTNGTPGSSGAYTQIEVASSAPTLYYYCTAHSGMGGQANTPNTDFWGAGNWSANLWGISEAFTSGWGADAWGTGGSWGEATDEVVQPTGLSLTSSLGTLDAYAEQGWGRAAWGSEIWGESYDPVVSVTGLSATSSLGDLAYAASTSGWGRLGWGKNDWDGAGVTEKVSGLGTTSSLGSITVTAEINTGWGQDGWGVENWGQSGQTVVIVSGVEATTASGEDVSWGKQTWGSATTGWGGEYYLTPADVMGLTGLSATSTVGAPTAISDFTGIPTGQSASTGIGSVSIDFSIIVNPTGVSATSSVGAITPADVMGLSGLEATSANGSITVTSNPTIVPTGFGMTASTGTLDPADQIMGLTGVSATASTGSLTPADVMGLTGVSATASVSPIGVAPLGYERITATQSAGYSRVTQGN